jgi:hypothetical protein
MTWLAVTNPPLPPPPAPTAAAAPATRRPGRAAPTAGPAPRAARGGSAGVGGGASAARAGKSSCMEFHRAVFTLSALPPPGSAARHLGHRRLTESDWRRQLRQKEWPAAPRVAWGVGAACVRSRPCSRAHQAWYPWPRSRSLVLLLARSAQCNCRGQSWTWSLPDAPILRTALAHRTAWCRAGPHADVKADAARQLLPQLIDADQPFLRRGSEWGVEHERSRKRAVSIGKALAECTASLIARRGRVTRPDIAADLEGVKAGGAGFSLAPPSGPGASAASSTAAGAAEAPLLLLLLLAPPADGPGPPSPLVRRCVRGLWRGFARMQGVSKVEGMAQRLGTCGTKQSYPAHRCTALARPTWLRSPASQGGRRACCRCSRAAARSRTC